MLSKEEIECCKNEARNFIEFMETAGDNAGWTRGLMWYIDKLEIKIKELSKGQQSLIKSRRKWKKRYYKMKNKNKDLQQSVEQIYDDYQDIGRIAFDYSDKIDQLESDKQKLIEKLAEESKQLEHDILTMSIDTGNKYSLKLIHQAEGMKKQNDRILEILKEE